LISKYYYYYFYYYYYYFYSNSTTGRYNLNPKDEDIKRRSTIFPTLEQICNIIFHPLPFSLVNEKGGGQGKVLNPFSFFLH